MPNQPYLDASVAWRIKSGDLPLEEPDYSATVEAILSVGLATEVVALISAGKEANVYLCTYNGAPLAVKAYRLYRTSHRGGRPIKIDTMSWIAVHEFEMMRQAWKGGAPVPAPARRVENMFSIRYIGGEDGPAPRLQHVELEEPVRVLSGILTGVEELAKAGVVHADLSAFNILVHGGRQWFIDFSGALRVDRSGTAPWRRLVEGEMYLTRGLRALQAYFRRYDLRLPIPALVTELAHYVDRSKVIQQLTS